MSDAEFERERSKRLHLPAGPIRHSVSMKESRPISPLPARGRKAQQPAEAAPVRQSRSERSTAGKRSAAVLSDQPAGRQATAQMPVSGASTPLTPSTPARLTPDVPVASTPPSRSWSPESAILENVVDAAEVAAQSSQPAAANPVDVVRAPQAEFKSQQPAVPAEPIQQSRGPQGASQFKLQQPVAHAVPQQQPQQQPTADMAFEQVPAVPAARSEPATPTGSDSDSSGSFHMTPPRQLVASRAVNLPMPAAAAQLPARETAVPDSPSASSVSSVATEEDEEPYVFDEAAAAAKAIEKGKGVLSQPEIRPVRACCLACSLARCSSWLTFCVATIYCGAQ